MDSAPQTINNELAKCSNQTNSQPSRVSTWNDDIFCVKTIKECEQIFEEYCEQRVDQLAESKEKLSILRSCLDLSNRLDGTPHTRFAGRVLIFLARVIPLYDQSGVNLRSDFYAYDLPALVKKNLEQLNEPNSGGAKGNGSLVKHDDMDIEEGETLSDDDEEVGSENTTTFQEDVTKLYEKFWRMQQYLHQPHSLYDKNVWLKFRTLVDTLVLYFEGRPATRQVWNLKNSYMTEPKSFGLQMNDVNLRRCFFVQILIVLQYLDLPVETRPDMLILDKHQNGWIVSMTARIYTLLSLTPNYEEGHEFCGLVSQVLKSEELWNHWKNEKCKEPRLPVEDDDMINMRGTYQKKRKMSDELKCAKPYNLHVIGSQEMTRLWNRKPYQHNAPDIVEYFTTSLEERTENFKNPNTSFRILRLLRKSPYFFQPTKDCIQSLHEYLKALSDKHFNPQPNQQQQQQQLNRQQNNNNQTNHQPSNQLTMSKATTPSATPTPTNSNSNESTPNTEIGGPD